MGAAIERLLSMELGSHVDDLLKLQMKAASERLAEQRGTIRVLERRSRELGIDRIESPSELVPLLFAHSTYKSYPESFIVDGRWERLSQWLDTVSTVRASAVDMAGVSSIDDWIGRLAHAGTFISASSGTSGRNSLLPLNADDVELLRRFSVKTFGFPRVVEARRDRPFTFLGPSNAPMRFALSFRLLADAFGRPGAIHSLTDVPMRLDDNFAAAALRRRMADGSAAPSELAAFEMRAVARRAEIEADILEMSDRVLGYRSEPQILYGPLSMFWRLLEAAREQGIPDGTFHSDTVITMGGGRKGVALPDDFEQQLEDFFGAVQYFKGYGMSEISLGFMMCEDGAYHCPPHLTLLILDETGERWLEPGPDGKVKGRVGIFDSGITSRWGGIVTGDQATANFSSHCSCGRPGPTVEDSVVRYSELSAGGDDKLTCGGTIDAYIRGALQEPSA